MSDLYAETYRGHAETVVLWPQLRTLLVTIWPADDLSTPGGVNPEITIHNAPGRMTRWAVLDDLERAYAVGVPQRIEITHQFATIPGGNRFDTRLEITDGRSAAFSVQTTGEADAAKCRDAITALFPLSDISAFATVPYVPWARIDELRHLTSAAFDFARLVRLCEELNTCAAHSCWFATGSLLRAIIDHVPPIFGCPTFADVVKSGLGRSLAQTFGSLDVASRKIADQHLHQMIRPKEDLPTEARVNFAPQLDALLGEIVRRVRMPPP